MPEYNGGFSAEEKLDFKRRVDQKALVGRQFDPYLSCTRCNYTMQESIAKAAGHKCCPNCGGTEVKVQTLNYDPSIPENPLPTVREAEAQSRASRPPR